MERYLCFRAADLFLALPVARIAEVAPVPVITRIPRPAPHIEGLAIRHGRAFPVMDLRKRLGLVNPAIDHRTRLVVAILDGMSGAMGFIVDAVGEILTLGEDGEAVSAPAPHPPDEIRQRVVEVGGRQVFLPDLARLANL